jgi:hypothetical protein
MSDDERGGSTSLPGSSSPGHGGRQDAAAAQLLLQPTAGPVQAAAERRLAQAEPAGGEVVALPLQAAEDQRGSERIRQATDLLLKGLGFARGLGARSVPGREIDPRRDLAPPPTHRPDLGPSGDPAGHAVQPGGDRLALSDRLATADQHQERRLERVLGLV